MVDMLFRDENGNTIAPVSGGPYDGESWLVQDAIEGDRFVPLKAEVNRPVYRLMSGRWRFVEFERESTWQLCGNQFEN